MAKTGKCENYRPPRACHVGEGDWRSCATWGTSFTVRTSRTGSGCALRFGGSLPTSFTGRASRPGSDATCVVQRGRCPDGLGKPRPFAHGDGLHGGTEPECNHHEYALEFCAGQGGPRSRSERWPTKPDGGLMKTGTGSAIRCIYVSAQALLVAACPPFHQPSQMVGHRSLRDLGPPYKIFTEADPRSCRSSSHRADCRCMGIGRARHRGCHDRGSIRCVA